MNFLCLIMVGGSRAIRKRKGTGASACVAGNGGTAVSLGMFNGGVCIGCSEHISLLLKYCMEAFFVYR